MSNSKPLKVYWSMAAIAFAGDDLAPIQHRLLREVDEVVSQAHDWFLHIVTRDDEESEQMLCCQGQEEEEQWLVVVQLGEFRDIEPEPDEEPLPEIMGTKPNMPAVLEDEENERFVELPMLGQ